MSFLENGTYDPGAVGFTLNGVEITGWAEGDMITVEKNEPHFNVHVGTKGEVSRARIRDNTYTVTIRLQQVSPSIPAIEGFKILDNVTKMPPLVVLKVKDPATKDELMAGKAWLMEDPTRAWGNEISVREYTFFVVDGITASSTIDIAADSVS